MKALILERYSRTQEGRYIIDINADKISDLYDDFDKQAPYIKKELDQNLVDYLAESARDLDKEAFIIRIGLAEAPNEAMMERITTSINSYFQYLKTIELRELRRNMRTSLIFLFMGMAILFLSVWVNQQLSEQASVLSKVFAEGLNVAAWVSLWEALATFLVNWTPYSRQIRLYERIAHAPVEFITIPATEVMN